MGVNTRSVTKRFALSVLLAGALVGASACASSTGGGGASSNPDLITRADIVENPNFTNALELIRQIRPRWLRATRGTTFSSGGPQEAVVFLDGIRFGDLGSLRSINLVNVDHMEFLDGRDATTLYGTGYMGGAIQIVSRTSAN